MVSRESYSYSGGAVNKRRNCRCGCGVSFTSTKYGQHFFASISCSKAYRKKAVAWNRKQQKLRTFIENCLTIATYERETGVEVIVPDTQRSSSAIYRRSAFFKTINSTRRVRESTS